MIWWFGKSPTYDVDDGVDVDGEPLVIMMYTRQTQMICENTQLLMMIIMTIVTMVMLMMVMMILRQTPDTGGWKQPIGEKGSGGADPDIQTHLSHSFTMMIMMMTIIIK